MSEPSLPPRPVMAFQVGVVGDRRLSTDMAALRAAAARKFAEIRKRAAELHAADQAQAAPLYAPFAARLRCLSGLQDGAESVLAETALDEGWELVVTLPSDPELCASALEGAALDRFRSLLSRASVICSLDANRVDGAAYAAAREQAVEQSDLLLAVWDGLPAQAQGEAAQAVQEALRRGLPVLALPPANPAESRWEDGSPGDIAALLRAALLPQSEDDDLPQSYFVEPSIRAGWAKTAIFIYERLINVGASTPKPAAPSPAPEAPAAAGLHAAFEAADRRATDHAARYRAAGLMRYGLILPATAASFVAWYGATWLQPLGSLAQFAILVFIVAFSRLGWWAPSHRRFTTYRALAEYLRNGRLLASLSAVAEMPGAAAHLEPATDWTAWYGRAVMRQIGLESAHYNPERVAAAAAFVSHEAQGQIHFLLRRADRFETMARRLRLIGVTLTLLGIGFSAIRAGLLLAGSSSEIMQGFNELAMVLPAMAPVFLGLLSFNEYITLAARYRAVAAALQTLVEKLERAPSKRASVLPVVRRIAEAMLAESADWKRLITAQTMSAY